MGTSHIPGRVNDTPPKNIIGRNSIEELVKLAQQCHTQMVKGYPKCTNGKGVYLKLMYNMIKEIFDFADNSELDGGEWGFIRDFSKSVLDKVSPEVSNEMLVEYTIELAENRFNYGFEGGDDTSLKDCPLQFPMLQKCEQQINSCKNYVTVPIIKNLLEKVKDDVPKEHKIRYNIIRKKYIEQIEKCEKCTYPLY